jgi:hypothetical protein
MDGTGRAAAGAPGTVSLAALRAGGSIGCYFDFQGDQNGSDMNVNGPNPGPNRGPDSGGSGVTHVYNDAGTQFLEVNTDCGSWTLKVVTATAAPWKHVR